MYFHCFVPCVGDTCGVGMPGMYLRRSSRFCVRYLVRVLFYWLGRELGCPFLRMTSVASALDHELTSFVKNHFKEKTETSGCHGCTVDDEITVLNTPFITFIGLLEKYGINDKSTFG